MAIFGDFLRLVHAASRVQHVSDLQLKFALRHTMCGSMADIQFATAEISREKMKYIEIDRKKKPQGKKYKLNGLPYSTWHNV